MANTLKKNYVIGGFLILAALFLTIALISFDRADIPKTNSIGEGLAMSNSCGFLGVELGNALISSVGYISSFFVPIALVIIALAFLRIYDFGRVYRILNHVLTAGLFITVFMSFFSSNTIFWGGYYGKFIEYHLKLMLGNIGALLLVFFSFITYIFLILDFERLPSAFDNIKKPVGKFKNGLLALFEGTKAAIADKPAGANIKEYPMIEEKNEPDEKEAIIEAEIDETGYEAHRQESPPIEKVQSIDEMVKDFKTRKELKEAMEKEGAEIVSEEPEQLEGNLDGLLSMKDILDMVDEPKDDIQIAEEPEHKLPEDDDEASEPEEELIISSPVPDDTAVPIEPKPDAAPVVEEEKHETHTIDKQDLEKSAIHTINKEFVNDFRGEEDTDEEEAEKKDYQLPPITIFDEPSGERDFDSEEHSRIGKVLEKKLKEFKVLGDVNDFYVGPVITQYEVTPAPGMKVSKFVNLADDLALVMRAKAIRVAPIHGKAVIGIEVPNKEPDIVSFRKVLESEEYKESKSKLTMALGVDIQGQPFAADLAKMPHLLIAGATGSGKSVCLNTIICGFLFNASPDELKLIMIDPKMLELTGYQDIPHLLHPVVTDPNEAAKALQWAVREMERRYKLLSKYSVRNIKSFNSLMHKKRQNNELKDDEKDLPYLVIVVDELADLMMTVSGDIESPIARLAQMARAVGIHLILATQRPSVDVLTGTIKANFPARIAFQVSSKIDSRTIIDSIGADKLLGRGDMLFKHPTKGMSIRLHGAYISDEEINDLVAYTKSQNYEPEEFGLNFSADPDMDDELNLAMDDENSLLRKAIELVVHTQQASASMLQRKLKIGYPRAGRLVDQLEELRIIGPPQGSKPREVIVEPDFLDRLSEGYDEYD